MNTPSGNLPGMLPRVAAELIPSTSVQKVAKTSSAAIVLMCWSVLANDQAEAKSAAVSVRGVRFASGPPRWPKR